MKITLKCEQPHYDLFTGKSTGIERTIVHEFNMSDLGEGLEDLELFLRGIGFNFTGRLEIVDEDDKQPGQTEQPVYNFEELEKRWAQATSNAFGSQPNEPLDKKCKQCGLPENVMAQHKCWDPRCPIHLN